MYNPAEDQLRQIKKDLERYIEDTMHIFANIEKMDNGKYRKLIDEETYCLLIGFERSHGLERKDTIDSRRGAQKLVNRYMDGYYNPREQIRTDLGLEHVYQKSKELTERSLLYNHICNTSLTRTFQYPHYRILIDAVEFIADILFIKQTNNDDMKEYAKYRCLSRLGFKPSDEELMYINTFYIDNPEHIDNLKTSPDEEMIKKLDSLKTTPITEEHLREILDIEFRAIPYMSYLVNKEFIDTIREKGIDGLSPRFYDIFNNYCRIKSSSKG
ncbi:MAG: hypothetical protein V1870_02875 [Candidatus Aenigmatarchaeota archaeon]